MSQKLFLNGRILDINDAHISPNDSGFLYGAGLFETMVAFNSKVFALKDHLDRLFFSLEALQFPHEFSADTIEAAIYQLLEANGLVDARIRLTVTNGPMSLTDKPSPTLLITATAFQGYPEDFYKQGIKVVLTGYKQNPANPIFHHKTTNYLPRLMAMNHARQHGAAEALWFTVDNRLAEGSMSNVFLVKDSVLYTPPIETPVLPGVAREKICELALRDDIELVEKELVITDLLEADEVFLSNVVMRVLPVNSIEKHVVGDGEVGPITQKVVKLYNELLMKECGFSE